MEQIKTLTANIQQNEPMRTFSENQQIFTPTGKPAKAEITPLEHAAYFAVINKSRLVNGWTTRTAKDLDATIRAWFDILGNYYRIPTEMIHALYLRALDTRQTYLQNGKEPPMMNAELLAACWTGENGLRKELENQRISAGRTLTANAGSQCQHCFGSGMKYKFDENGKTLGVIGKCNHE